MLTHSHHSTESSNHGSHCGKEIDEGNDSSSISTMSSIDIGSDEEEYVSDNEIKIEADLKTETDTISDEASSHTKTSDENSMKRQHRPNEEEEDTDDKSSSDSEVASDTWTLFETRDVDEPKPKDTKTPQGNVYESHESSHFMEASKQVLSNQEDAFMIPKPDSSGNFLHTSLIQDVTAPQAQAQGKRKPSDEHTESKSAVTILSSNHGDSNNHKEEELFSVGADILMAKSLITGRFTLEDPSQATDSSTLKSSALPIYHHIAAIKPSYGVLVTAFLMFFVSSSGIYYFAQERYFWKQSALQLANEVYEIRKDFEQREYMIRKDFEQREYMIRRYFEERELMHLEKLANATSRLRRYEEYKNDFGFSWEEKKDPNLFHIENCWLSAQASFELGLCTQKLKKDWFHFFGFGNVGEEGLVQHDMSNENKGEDKDKDGIKVNPANDSTVDSSDMDKVDTESEKNELSYKSVEESIMKNPLVGSIGELTKEFFHTVLYPKDPKKLLDGSIWSDIIDGRIDE